MTPVQGSVVICIGAGIWNAQADTQHLPWWVVVCACLLLALVDRCSRCRACGTGMEWTGEEDPEGARPYCPHCEEHP